MIRHYDFACGVYHTIIAKHYRYASGSGGTSYGAPVRRNLNNFQCIFQCVTIADRPLNGRRYHGMFLTVQYL